ncbi:MAG: universal stress protein [Chloroflexota bacterium]
MLKKILVPLDGSKLAECVLPYVEELARGCQVEEVVLMRACEPPTIPADYPATMRQSWDDHVKTKITEAQQQCRLYLTDVEKRLSQLGVKVTTETYLGRAVEQIVGYANQNAVDLVIMASHGRSGPSRWVYGSVADRVLRSLCVPVLMVRAPGCVAGI